MKKKTCFILLIILFLLFGLTTISAKDNQTNEISQVLENQNNYDTQHVNQRISDNIVNDENIQQKDNIENITTYNNEKRIDKSTTSTEKTKDSSEEEVVILDDLNYYSSSSSTDNVKQPTMIKYVKLGDVEYGSTVKIVGRLLNNDTALKYKPVTLTINNKTYNLKTDGAGYIRQNYTVNNYDTQKITFKYNGNKQYLPSTNSTTFKVKEITSIKIASMSNVKYGSTVKIVGRLLNNNTALKYKPVTLTINNKTYNLKTDGAGYIRQNYTVNNYDTQKITFKYNGNKQYLPSTNSTTFKVKQPTEIRIAKYGNVFYGSHVEIVGRLLNNDSAVKFTPVTLTINDETYDIKSDGAGYIKLNYTVNNYDTQKVTFRFAGSSLYLSSNNSTSFNVIKPTEITFDSPDFVELNKKFTIVGSLKTIKGEVLINTPVNININSDKTVVNTNSNGVFQYTYQANILGNNNLSISYSGNNDYIGNIVYSTFKVYNLVNVIIDTPQKANNGSKIDLRVYVTYDPSVLKTINNGKVTLKVNGQTLTSNVMYGKAIISYYLPNRTGTYLISAAYEGDTDMGFATKNITLTSGSISSSESAILGNKNPEKESIALINGVPNLVYMTNFAWADENEVYNITSEEILRVMKLDSYCQQVYGFTPKYTFFKAVGNDVYFVISREKWNVIARALNAYHVNKGYSSVLPPATVTVNLSGKIRYYPVYYDAQEWINGHMYTCGPTSMSMISQALNCYSSERKLAGIYQTTASAGTDESKIIAYSPSVHMKMYDVRDNKESVTKALQEGKMIFWHIRGHYMCIIAYNSQEDRYLCLNPSGPSHNIAAVQWATWNQIMSTDRSLKDNGFMSVTPCWDLSSEDKVHVQYYYNNMGGKYSIPYNLEYPNNGNDNQYIYSL